jgi:hypothetical protein
MSSTSHFSDFILPSMAMVEACRADDFDFFYPWMEAGKLTVAQMHHAAMRYHLGKTKSGYPMFWMIDDMLTPYDAHIANGVWLSTLLKAREPEVLEFWRVQHCLFGLHLLATDISRHTTTVAIVEKEQSAVILSELFPECLWMAYASAMHLDIRHFAPLQGRTVILYPPTDPMLSTFPFFEELAVSIRRHYNIPITVSPILEDYATEEQKQRKIDLIDFLFDSS